MPTPAEEVLAVNRRLLDAVAAADWKAYKDLVADDITCFEPEAKGQLVEGLPFHKFYFDLAGDRSKGSTPVITTLASPVVKMLGDNVAVVACVRLVQKVDTAGHPVVSSCEETRVWVRMASGWKHVHFHRSLPG
ncbi:MAG: nuclear transport factor 2 family protein [Planctomycetia bacterium]|nr:nuclear transport factor 2 family protein [Planctomycetia bacterium]